MTFELALSSYKYISLSSSVDHACVFLHHLAHYTHEVDQRESYSMGLLPRS
jgi:hypothetical protein